MVRQLHTLALADSSQSPWPGEDPIKTSLLEIPWAITSRMQHRLFFAAGFYCSYQMSLLNWERTGKKKQHNTTNWQQETESSKTPNSAKGERQFCFSLKALLKHFYEPKTIKEF